METTTIERDNIYEPMPTQKEKVEKKSYIGQLEDAFRGIPDEIQKELNSSEKNPENSNNWLNCFVTRATIINMLLYQAYKYGELDFEKYTSANTKMKELDKRLKGLTLDELYQGKNAVIPDEIQQELLNFLTWSNILGNKFC